MNMKGRRPFLKGIAMGSIGFTGTASAQYKGKEIIHIQRPFDDPITNGHLNEMRAEAAQNADGIGTHSISAEPEAEIEADGKIVSAVLTPTDDGAISQEIHIASRPRDVQKAHSEGEKTANKYKEKSEESTVRLLSSDDWYTVEDSKVTNYSDPYGDVVLYYKYLQHRDNDYDAYRERFAMFPGMSEYNSDWWNERGRVDHHWSDKYMSLQDHEPFGGTEGSVTDTMKLESGSIGYSYSYRTEETKVDDDTSDRENRASFDVYFRASSRETTSGFDPGSLAHQKDSALSATYLNVSNTATFGDPVTGNAEDKDIGITF